MATKLLHTSWVRVYFWRPEWPGWRADFFTDGLSSSRPGVTYPPCWFCHRDYHKKAGCRLTTPWLVLEVNFGYAHGR